MQPSAAFFVHVRLPNLVAVEGFRVCEPHFLASALLEQNAMKKPPIGRPDADETTQKTQPLALRPRQAAFALSISQRLLWSLTKSGKIPHLKLGRAVLYPVSLLEEYLTAQAKGGQR